MSSPLDPHENSARLARALVALEKMQARLEASEREKREPIAIIGMACRFPGGANHPEALWALLREGGDAIVEVPADRWAIDDYYDPDPAAEGKMYTRWGGFLKGVRLDELDARFYGIAPREAASMDPQQRLMLEVTWEALANAGQVQERIANSLTGVFVGVMLNDYAQLQAQQAAPALMDAYLAFGNDSSFMAGRISYILGAQGPSMAVNTACSSSLVTVQLACQSLRARESNMAIAGGVSVILAPDGHIVSSRLRSQSPTGRCRTFDAAADGYVRGEGCGVVVLKRLSDALADKDPVLAVIRGGAVNHDGPSGGLTVPSGPAQEAVIRRALANAGVEPSQVDYVEAHGTGTPLGDPIEVRALQKVFAAGRESSRPLGLGSIKTNVGHLEAAAGIAGLMKVVLMLQHREIPPHLHLERPTTAIPWSELPIAIPTRLRPWDKASGRRVAGVSSFGLSGINAHLLLEEAPESTSARPPLSPERSAHLLTLSARDEKALLQLAREYQTWLGGAPGRLEDVCYTASARRSHHEHRLAVVGRTREQLVEHLGAFLRGEPLPAVSQRVASPRRPKVVFVFSGQGSQWPTMARELLRVSPVFRATLEDCERAMRAHGEFALLSLLEKTDDTSWMEDIGVIQPMLFAIAVALAAQWRAWAIHPDAVVGHSMGEVAAAHVAGVLSLEDAARVICRRSALLRRVRGQGGMALVGLSLEEARAVLAGFEDRLSIAASNGPTTTVLAGDAVALQAVMERLKTRNVFCRAIKVDVASHSPQVDPLLPELREVLGNLQPRAASLPVYSTVTGGLTDGTDWDARYWQRNLREPVLFSQVIEQLLASPHHVFVELSPHPILTQSIERIVGASRTEGLVLPSLRRDEAELEVLLQSLGALHTAGHPIDWRAVYPEAGECTSLPGYPWQRSRYWLEPRPAALRSVARPVDARLEAREEPGNTVTSAHAEGTPSRFYDDSVERERVLAPDEVYLTFGIQRRPVPGFSWLLSVYGLPERPEHTELLLEGQRGLRSVLFRGVRWSSVRKVLDFGCGYASDLISLARKFPHLRLDGYTISAEQAAIDGERVRARGLQERVRVFARDSAKDAFPDRYDVAFGFEVATHVADKRALFANLSRSLHNGGFLLLADFVANGVSAINVEETASYNVNAEEWAELLARHRFRLVEGVDISREAACFLEDPGFDRHLEVVATRFKLSDLVKRNFDAMRNFGKALDKGLMSYALLVAQKDEHAGAPYLARVNRAKLAALTPFTAFEDAGAWAAPAEDSELEGLAPLASREWVYEVTWPQKPRAPKSEAQRKGEASGRWLILCDRTGTGEALAARLRARGERCALLFAEPGAQRLGADEAHVESTDPATRQRTLGADEMRVEPTDSSDWQRVLEKLAAEGSPLRGVVHLWNLDLGGVSPDATTLGRGCGSLLTLVQRLGGGMGANTRLWLVTRGAQSVSEGSPVSVTQAPLWGAGRVLALEHPELWGGLVDLSASPDAQEVDALCEELWAPDGEDQLALRGKTRHVARLVRAEVPVAGKAPWRSDGAYLITGGLGGLGLQVAKSLVAHGARHLLLSGRTELPAERDWAALPSDSLFTSQVKALRELQAQGASVRYVRCDVGEPDQARALIDACEQDPVPLVGIFHAAGISVHRALKETGPEDLASVFHPKAMGAWMLHELTRHLPLHCFVLFSSASSVWGSQGMTAYAAANHFLDALAHHRKSQGLAATCINWGRWSEGGMAGSEQAQRFFSQVGLEAMPTEAALMLLERLVGAGVTQRTVASVDWSRFKPLQEARRHRPLLEHISVGAPAPKTPVEQGAVTSELLRRLEEAPEGRRRNVLQDFVRGEASRVLGAEPSSLTPGQGFFQMGMNSLMSVELKNHLERSLRHKLPSTLAFDYPTVAELTDFLAKEVPALAVLLPVRPGVALADAVVVDVDPLLKDEAIFELLSEAERLSETALQSLAQSFPGEGSNE
ncbi:type I polyketide synthase [Myxococcus sp. K38C18041901]|uniref:type I polyketide synthase n=1 Tax=Myxococcus guangdongensis TaxID=2906760 RepID=UPI0020A73720|nr:type I polyketide synthase [Myxococcus guangdongensis]MCP3063708.1 type I polyketide synthase [Myxococcus guangdongensis]